MLTTLAVAGYRSLRDLVVPLAPLVVVTGANGSGKSSLYRSLRLLADVAQGSVVASLAREGGLASTLWAGPETLSRAMRRGDQPVQGTRRTAPVSLRLGFASEDLAYAVDLGLPEPDGAPTAFHRDPRIKRECVWAGDALRPSAVLADRRGPAVTVREGRETRVIASALRAEDSMLTHAADVRGAPELLELRDRMRAWRFYDHLRTDRDAPARRASVGTRTPVLAHDGADLPAALQTVREIGDAGALHDAVADAFPGAAVDVRSDDGWFTVEMRQHGLLRPLSAAELSDGTLRYLLWVAALLTPRPPELMVLNEPETSLHPDLLPALARLVARASRDTQVIVVSHAAALVGALRDEGAASIVLEKELGETRVRDQDALERPAWTWPKR